MTNDLCPRFRFVQDDDGHWYMIPAHMRKDFIEALATGDADEFCVFNDRFSEYRTGGGIGHITFADPREDQR